MDIWSRLQRERIMYIGQDLDDEFANQVPCRPVMLPMPCCNNFIRVQSAGNIGICGRWWPCS
jgi:hypothetical protein